MATNKLYPTKRFNFAGNIHVHARHMQVETTYQVFGKGQMLGTVTYKRGRLIPSGSSVHFYYTAKSCSDDIIAPDCTSLREACQALARAAGILPNQPGDKQADDNLPTT